jgi:tRNA(Ile)-lysidine synthase
LDDLFVIAMIKLQGKLPRELFVACSGGVDSMAALDFLSNNHDVTILFFDHDTPTSREALNFVSVQAKKYDAGFLYGTISRAKRDDESMEEYWRNERYKFFHSINGTVVTGHHLDDCVETWVWSSMHGTGKIIPYRNRNVIRPFRGTRKRDFELWADLKNVPHVEDDSNADTCYTRNYIRHEMMPHVLRVNPGIHKTIGKKVTEDAY